MNLDVKQKAAIFDRIWTEYVQAHGLGGMSKSDLDALLVWEYVQVVEKVNYFSLSTTFKIKESRAKNLLDAASIKYQQLDDASVWSELLDALKAVEYHVESLEKGQMRFHLKKPLLFRYLQHQARELNDSLMFNTASEYVVSNLDTLYAILDAAWADEAFGKKWTGAALERERRKIQRIIEKIGKNIGGNNLEDLKRRKRSKLPQMVSFGERLLGIGALVKQAFQQ